MRIQHNIMAMNAYRNYNRNTSALSKNLEKLSSGYKINRAGDDAAGLAISEKMRAQITGLNAAQKNVKDGISLVKTAEGAMQEIQDMLNRMDYLATQSANGTYDNEVDRANLQKEVDALKSEINRIADSANFNGINLLDGTMDEKADLTTKMDFTVGKGLPGVGLTLGVDTVLHKTVANADEGSKFSIDLHDYEFNNQKGDTMNITIGDTKIEIVSRVDHKTNGELDKLSGDDITDIILGTSADQADYTVTVNGNPYTVGSDISFGGQDFEIAKGSVDGRINFTQKNPPADKSEEVDPSMKVSIGGKVSAVKAQFSFAPGTFAAGGTVKIGDESITTTGNTVASLITDINGNSTKYDAAADPNDATKIILTAKNTGPSEAPTISYEAAKTDITPAAGTAGANGTAGVFEIDVTPGDTVRIGGTAFVDGTFNGTATDVTVDGVEYTVTGDLSGGNHKLTITEKGTTGADGTSKIYSGKAQVKYDVDGGDSGNLSTVKTAAVGATAATYNATIGTNWTGGRLEVLGNSIDWNGVDAASSIQEAIESGKLKFDHFDLSVTGTGANLALTFTAKTAGAAAAVGFTEPTTAGDVKIYNGSKFEVATVEKGSDLVQDPQTGDYNVSTTVISKVTAADKERLASTYFDLTEDMVTDGSKLTIADQTFTFTTDKNLIGEEGYVDATSGDLDQIAKNLTKAAEKNHVYTVGHDGSRISVTETLKHAAEYKVDANGVVKAPADGWDLRTAEGIANSLSFTSGTTKTGTGLTLQIGDTADSFNQLSVSIGDMHTTALGIADLDISNITGAQSAIGTIKAAINSVSSVRGDLGATQNRLEHTANNLSVMAENIQDAESTIRDTDVAEEMMAYTKNNILIQSAQAMLAQANAVPQGVLQLLG